MQNTRKNPTVQRNPRFVFAKSERATFFSRCADKPRFLRTLRIFFKTSGSIAKPYIEKLELDTSSLAEGSWENGKTFDPEKLSYDITLKNYGTDSLTILDSVSFDSEKYSVSAEYTGIENEARVVSVENGKKAMLDGIPFGTSAIVLKVTDKEDEDNLTAYTFNVTRPRDTENSVKESGIALTVERGELSHVKYNGTLEGQMLHADESGNVSGTSGVTSYVLCYRSFVYYNALIFNLNI